MVQQHPLLVQREHQLRDVESSTSIPATEASLFFPLWHKLHNLMQTKISGGISVSKWYNSYIYAVFIAEASRQFQTSRRFCAVRRSARHDVTWRFLWESRKWTSRCCLCSNVECWLCFWIHTRDEMATFISVPLKKSSEVDLVKPLSKFINATYQTSDEQGEYIRAVEELNKLRKSAVGRPLDKHESSLEVLLRYRILHFITPLKALAKC